MREFLEAIIFSLILTPITAAALTLLGIVSGKIYRSIFKEKIDVLAEKLAD